MRNIENFIRHNAVLLAHGLITAPLYLLCAWFFRKYADFIFFGNLFFGIVILYLFYNVLFKKTYAISFLQFVCVLLLIAATNELYSYNHLCTLFPVLEQLNPNFLVVGLIGIFSILLMIFKALSYIEPDSLNNESRAEYESEESSTSEGFSATHRKVDYRSTTSTSYHAHNRQTDSLDELPDNFSSFLQYLIVLSTIVVLFAVPAVVTIWIYQSELQITPLNLEQTLLPFTGYALLFILLLFALIFLIIIVISFVRYIFSLIRSFKVKDIEEAPIPPYPFSVMLVVVFLYFAQRNTDITLDKITNQLAIGDYLALPLTAMICIILFLLLVQITHAILVLLSNTRGIAAFLSKQVKQLKITPRVFQIVKYVVDIILGTLSSTLEFVLFIPDFFSSMSELVLADEDEDEGDEYGNLEELWIRNTDDETVSE